jgi:hypothetical protein
VSEFFNLINNGLNLHQVNLQMQTEEQKDQFGDKEIGGQEGKSSCIIISKRNGLAPEKNEWDEWVSINPYKIRAKALEEKLLCMNLEELYII